MNKPPHRLGLASIVTGLMEAPGADLAERTSMALPAAVVNATNKDLWFVAILVAVDMVPIARFDCLRSGDFLLQRAHCKISRGGFYRTLGLEPDLFEGYMAHHVSQAPSSSGFVLMNPYPVSNDGIQP